MGHIFLPARFALLLLMVGCGLSAGRLPLGPLALSGVGGATVEPGLAASVEGAVTRALVRAGSPPDGPVLRVTLIERGHDPVGVGPFGQGQVWQARLGLRGEIPSRPGCKVEVEASEGWSLGASPEAMLQSRADALERISEQLAARLVDALISEPACHPQR